MESTVGFGLLYSRVGSSVRTLYTGQNGWVFLDASTFNAIWGQALCLPPRLRWPAPLPGLLLNSTFLRGIWYSFLRTRFKNIKASIVRRWRRNRHSRANNFFSILPGKQNCKNIYELCFSFCIVFSSFFHVKTEPSQFKSQAKQLFVSEFICMWVFVCECDWNG